MDGIDQYRKFVQNHKHQLIASAVPEHFWQMLYRKMTNQIFDAGEAFQLLLLDYSEVERDPEDPVWTVAVSKPEGLHAGCAADIYIIDHAWTFRPQAARQQLHQVPELLRRMCIIMGVGDEVDTAEARIDAVMGSLWRYAQMYAIGGNDATVEERMPIWYVMDELGSGITHSDEPNCRVVPFIFADDSTTYSIVFPVRDIECEAFVTRDFVAGSGTHDDTVRDCLLLPWRPLDYTDEPIEQPEPAMEYFLAGHVEESLPDADAAPPLTDESRPMRVYAAYRYVNEYLTDAAFELVDNEQAADIVWINDHFKTFAELSRDSPDKFINQFPFENVITIKDLLAIVGRRMAGVGGHSDAVTLETNPRWLPTTYNLKTELAAFVSYFQRRKAAGLDNHWIVKPWNLARGLDMHITNDLGHIMRLQPTGPKIAQKYIDRPVLFRRPEVSPERGVKFDVRYVVLLSAVKPLVAHVYRNFFLRFANKPFALNRYDDYQQHFTVMNYAEAFELRHIPCAEFRELWAEQYPEHEWDGVEADIVQMLRELLVAATEMAEPPCAIASSAQSRALYAADIMLEWVAEEGGKMRPKLLEVNWGPDCKRACEYYPDFYNDVFKLLFKGEENDKVFRKIVE